MEQASLAEANIAEWLVLRCAPARTIAVAGELADLGGWTPTWKRMRRVPRANVRRLVPEACIPSFVFIPAALVELIPDSTPCRPMRFDGRPVIVEDRQLEALRTIADKPKIAARKLPRPGQRLKFLEGPFQGLEAYVLRCDQSYATVEVPGFAHPMKVPPFLLLKN